MSAGNPTHKHDKHRGMVPDDQLADGTAADGDVPISNGDGTRTWGVPPGGAPSGSAGGDLSGTYPNPSVVDDSHDHTASTLSGVYEPGGTDVAVADGGTGASTKAGGFDALSPMTTQDDIIIGGASGTGTRLGKGSDGQVLTVDPSTHHLVWATPTGGGSGTLTTVKDEGSNLSTAVVSLDFVGAGVTATGTTAVTVTIPGGGGTAVGATHQRVARTAGSLTLTGNTTTHTEVNSALRLTLAAATGDVILAGITGIMTAGANGEAALDIATIVSSAIVNRFTGGGSRVGIAYAGAGGTEAVAASVTYVAQSGDISGGNIVISPSFYQGGAGGGTLFATTTYQLTFWAVNLKQ